MTDSFTAELFDYAPDVLRVAFPVSRLVVDPERLVDDSREPMAACGMGVIYTSTSQSTPLRAAPTPQVRKELLDRFYYPHHAALSQAVSRALWKFGSCVVVDCHSFPSRPRAYDLDQSARRPDICLGTDQFHTPDWLTEIFVGALEAEGYSVEVNTPFAGSLVPSKHYESDSRVASIMVEINRGLYVDESSASRLQAFTACRDRLGRGLKKIRDALGQRYAVERLAALAREHAQ